MPRRLSGSIVTAAAAATVLAALAATPPSVAQPAQQPDGPVLPARSLGFAPDQPESCTPEPYARCTGYDFTGRDLSGRDLTGASLADATLDGVDLSGATLTDADLTSASLVTAILDGATLTDATLLTARVVGASVRDVDASGINASWATLDDSDFTLADLTEAYLAESAARNATFADADLTGAVLTNASLVGADLRGANLSNANLRGASLRRVQVDDTTSLAGADLSGAEWIDGTVCQEGSIGTCTPEPQDTGSETGQPEAAAPFPWFSMISAGFKVGEFAYSCGKNLDQDLSCLSSQTERELAAVRSDIATLSKQIERNHQATMSALNVIIRNQKDQDVRQAFQAVRDTLTAIPIALKKYEEFNACLDHLNKPSTPCLLSDINGNNPRPYPVSTYKDLYAGTTKPLADMDDGGPVARLLHATLWQFGGQGNYQRSQLALTGRALQTGIAGPAQRRQDGLLYSQFESMNSELNVAQQAQGGGRPAYLPGTAVVDMNTVSEYYVNSQAAYFGSIIAALQLQARAKDRLPFSESLEAQALTGFEGNRSLGLVNQWEEFSFPVTGAFNVTDPKRVGFFNGGNGRLYRVEHVYPATTGLTYPTFPFPSFGDLRRMQATLERAGVRISTLQRLYPANLPTEAQASWWASFGATKVAQVQSQGPNRGYTKFFSFTIGSGAPNYDQWRGNVARELASPCVMPVRMWDGKPSIDDAFTRDVRYRENDGYQGHITWTKDKIVAKNTSGKGTVTFTINALDTYNALVTNGAVPVYDLIRDNWYDDWKGRHAFSGVGVVYRCGGASNDWTTKEVASNYVTVTALTPTGLFTKVVTG